MLIRALCCPCEQPAYKRRCFIKTHAQIHVHIFVVTYAIHYRVVRNTQAVFGRSTLTLLGGQPCEAAVASPWNRGGGGGSERGGASSVGGGGRASTGVERLAEAVSVLGRDVEAAELLAQQGGRLRYGISPPECVYVCVCVSICVCVFAACYTHSV